MEEYRGNGYFEYEYGRFGAVLVYDGAVIARACEGRIIGYNRFHKKEINEWAAEYGYNAEWVKGA